MRKRRYKNTLAKVKDEVWLLQLKMSRTEVGKEGKSKMFLPNPILESRMKSWSEEEETGISQSAPQTGAYFEAC